MADSLRIRFLCTHCGKQLSSASISLGKKIKCPACTQTFTIEASHLDVSDLSSKAASSRIPETIDRSIDYDTALDSKESTTGLASSKGSKWLGRFELKELLGQGAFGRVYKAYDPTLDRLIALKVPIFGPGDAKKAARFQEEAKAAAQLRHPNIVPTFDSGHVDRELFIASQFIEGSTLSEIIKTKKIDFNQAALWIVAISRALHYAHEMGIVHRDVKPQNIMVDRRQSPQLMDFGLAKRLNEDAGMTTEGTLMGTPAYMAPEQARGDTTNIGAHSDQYSVGAMFYEMLTGTRVFDGPPHSVIAKILSEEPKPIKQINPDVPVDLIAIVQKSMHPDFRKRYATCSELADDVEQWLRGEPISARPITRAERFVRWTKKNPSLAGSFVFASICLLALGLLGAGFAFYQNRANRKLVEANDSIKEEQAKVVTALEQVTKEKNRAEQLSLDAEQARREAVKALEGETRASREAVEKLVRLEIANGTIAMEKSSPSTAMLWYANAWDLDQEKSNDPSYRIRFGVAEQKGPRLRGICFHLNQIDDVAIDYQGELLATRTVDETEKRTAQVYVWDYAKSELKYDPLQHEGPVNDLAFSPTSPILASLSESKVYLWDTSKGVLLQKLDIQGSAYDLEFTSNGNVLAVSGKNVIDLINMQTFVKLPQKLVVDGMAYHIEFSADGSRMLTALTNGDLVVWNTQTAQAVGTLIKHTVPNAQDLKFYRDRPKLHPQGSIVLCSDNGFAKACEVESGKELWREPTNSKCMTFSLDGSKCMIANGVNVHCLDTGTGAKLGSVVHIRTVGYIAPFGANQFVCASAGGVIYRWDMSTFQQIFPMLHLATFARGLKSSFDHRYIIAGSQDGTARVWEPAAFSIQEEEYKFDCGRADRWHGPSGESRSADNQFAIECQPGKITLKRSGQTIKQMQLTGNCRVSQFSPDGRYVAAFDGRGLHLFNTSDGSPVGEPRIAKNSNPLPPEFKPTIQFSLDSKRLAFFPRAFAEAVPAAVVVDIEREEPLLLLPGRSGNVGKRIFGSQSNHGLIRQAIMSHDGKSLSYFIDSSGEHFLVDVDTEEQKYVQCTQRGVVSPVTLSSESVQYFTSSSVGYGQLRDWTTGKSAGPQIRVPGIRLVYCDIDPSGTRVIALADNRLDVIDAKAGDVLFSIPNASAIDAWFSSDGKSVIADQNGRWTRYRLPYFEADASAVIKIASVMSGLQIDEQRSIAELDTDEFISNAKEYAVSFRKWRLNQNSVGAQPLPINASLSSASDNSFAAKTQYDQHLNLTPYPSAWAQTRYEGNGVFHHNQTNQGNVKVAAQLKGLEPNTLYILALHADDNTPSAPLIRSMTPQSTLWYDFGRVMTDKTGAIDQEFELKLPAGIYNIRFAVKANYTWEEVLRVTSVGFSVQ